MLLFLLYVSSLLQFTMRWWLILRNTSENVIYRYNLLIRNSVISKLVFHKVRVIRILTSRSSTQNSSVRRISINISSNVCVPVYVCVCVCARLCVYMCIYIYTYIKTYLNRSFTGVNPRCQFSEVVASQKTEKKGFWYWRFYSIYIYIYVCVCVCVCVRARARVFVCVWVP